MQWLIDLVAEKVIAEIGIPPVFIDRGDPAAYDFLLGDLVTDGLWHKLDLDTIVPSGAQAVTLSIELHNNGVNRNASFRRTDNVNDKNVSIRRILVANTYNSSDATVAVNTDRQISYKFSNIGWTAIRITVKGWWL